MLKAALKLFALVAIFGALALGAAACGDDDNNGAAETGAAEGDVAAVSAFCDELDRLEVPVEGLTELDPATTTDEDIDLLNTRLGGNVNNVGQAAQGAQIPIDDLGASLGVLQETIMATADPPTDQELTAVTEAAEDVDTEIAALQEEHCTGVEDAPDTTTG